MPCYHPLIRIEELGKWATAEDGHKYHPARVISQETLNDLELSDNMQKSAYHKTQIIPCGKCIGCRLDYSREWANRGYLEAKQWKQNYFVTITYDENHLPQPDEIETKDGFTYTDNGEWNGCLVKKDLTQFIKNVRQIMKRDHNQDNIRFMACGEYGEQGARPHYHIIFFNLNLPLEDLFEPKIINKEMYYRSHIIERAWNKGISNVSEASWNNIAYTARYITKKINGPESEDLYAENGKIKEFFRVSRMPGIGEQYYRDHWKEIYDKDEIIVKNKAGIVASRPPKYYDKIFEKEHPEEWKKIKAKREHMAKMNNKVKDQQSSLFRQEQNEVNERSKEEQHLKLQRMIEKL